MNQNTHPHPPQPLFAKQEEVLIEAYEKLKNTTRSTITQINEGTLVLDPKDQATITKIKKELDEEVEALHLAVSNYFGDCDKRKQKIEAEISEKIDIEGFGQIGDTLLTF